MKVMKLPRDAEGIFRKRPNRFLGIVDLVKPETQAGVKVHIHDPGRLPEILFEGNRVYLKRAASPGRKTLWDLVAGEVEGRPVFTNSSYHRKISTWYIETLKPFGDFDALMPEYRFGKSRLDFLVKKGERKTLVEVKGCTLARGDVALFPDAPTERGRRHLEELIKARELGMDAAVIFLVFREETRCFSPNEETDPGFSRTLERALDAGVKILLPVFSLEEDWLVFKGHIKPCELTEKGRGPEGDNKNPGLRKSSGKTTDSGSS